MNNIEKLTNEVIQFRNERDWKQFHNAKDLSISLLLEASELLELFQWKESAKAVEKNGEKMKDEIADIFIYTLTLCHDLDLNPEKIVEQKLKKNEEKYPVDKFFGSNKKYTEL